MTSTGSKIEARRRVRERQNAAAAARRKLEEQNTEDVAVLLVALARMAEAREAGRAALQRLKDRGMSLTGVAELGALTTAQLAVFKGGGPEGNGVGAP